MVVPHGVSPKGVQALSALRLPDGLMFIEVSGTGLAHLMRDGVSPGQPRMAIGIVVEHINQQRQLFLRRARLQRIGALIRPEAGRMRLRQLAQS